MKGKKILVVLLIAVAFALGIGATLYAQNIQRGQKNAEGKELAQPYNLGGGRGCGGNSSGCGGGYGGANDRGNGEDPDYNLNGFGCH
jgi:hypothetical protein